MASWTKKRGRSVIVYYWDVKLGKQVNLPREFTEQLDKLSDDEINRWVEEWEEASGKARDRIRRISLLSTDEIQVLIDQYQAERREETTGDRTLQNERILFNKYIIPYFIGVHRARDIRRWRSLGGGLRIWLTENSTLDLKTKGAVIQAVNRFGKWLYELNKIDTPWAFRTPRLRVSRRERKTPLPRIMVPDEVIKAAKEVRLKGKLNWAIGLLVGYFACLRPEETFALTMDDVLTGKDVEKESETLERLREMDLGCTIAVDINKALITGKKLGLPKNYYSNGVATVWHQEGGKLLAKYLGEFEGEKLFEYTKEYLFHEYRRDIRTYLGVTLHDLRRASGLFLGRTLGCDPFLLQDILRHGDIESTLEYTRRPRGERTARKRRQNFDEVG